MQLLNMWLVSIMCYATEEQNGALLVLRLGVCVRQDLSLIFATTYIQTQE